MAGSLPRRSPPRPSRPPCGPRVRWVPTPKAEPARRSSLDCSEHHPPAEPHPPPRTVPGVLPHPRRSSPSLSTPRHVEIEVSAHPTSAAESTPPKQAENAPQFRTSCRRHWCRPRKSARYLSTRASSCMARQTSPRFGAIPANCRSTECRWRRANHCLTRRASQLPPRAPALACPVPPTWQQEGQRRAQKRAPPEVS
jgi:hypothetical protein